ncbi:MAG: response regulator [Acidobacteriota bacterium]|nr:response regulator [Acidobacteriota bacterium]
MQTILIADDEESIRQLIEATLESPDRRLLLAVDGTSAFDMACRELPDLIVLDWMMPGMSGLAVVEKLRASGPTANIPIVLLTAMGGEKYRQQGLATGALAYLVKPFSPLELLQLVQQVLARNEQDHESGKGFPGKRPRLVFAA